MEVPPETASTSLPSAPWRPATLGFMLASLAGLALGLWPGALASKRLLSPFAPLPTLKCLAATQAAFLLIGYPLILMRRRLTGGEGAAPVEEDQTRRKDMPANGVSMALGGEKLCPLKLAVEAAGFLAAAVPFYVASAWFADAVATDVLRTALYLAGLFPLSWALGACLARPLTRTAAMLVAVGATLLLPGIWYVTAEFLPPASADWLWELAPLTAAWTTAASRAGEHLPRPLWAWLAWPTLGAVAVILCWAFSRPRPER